jgi:hypothetical protein
MPGLVGGVAITCPLAALAQQPLGLPEQLRRARRNIRFVISSDAYSEFNNIRCRECDVRGNDRSIG